MKLPKNCVECKFCGFGGKKLDNRACMLNGNSQPQHKVVNSRMNTCPLTGIVPHGRLIDADALLKECDKVQKAMEDHGREYSFSFMRGGDVCTTWYNVEIMIEDMPTIIQTDKGD